MEEIPETTETMRLNSLVESIQQLNATEHEELFKLLYQNKCKYTQNNNGIFLNLSWLPAKILEKMELFVQFCKASRRELLHYETLCKELSSGITTTHESAPFQPPVVPPPANAGQWMNFTRNTSTMKFYLMKKRYTKMGSFDTQMQSDLEKEHFLL